MNTRRLAGIAILVILATACQTAAPAAAPPAAPGATQPPAAAQKPATAKDTVTFVFPQNQGTLDPHFAATTQEMLVTRNIYNALLKYKPNTTELTGDLATASATAA